jgi:hypothetical protein
MFSYYVVDPFTSDPDVGDKLIPIVRRAKDRARHNVGSVTRDCSDIQYPDEKDSLGRVANQNRVFKRERQGYFDNLHIAPRMAVKDPIVKVRITGLTHDWIVSFPNEEACREACKMNEVVMAPFCAHDCFHLHWRWSDNLNDEKGTFGWGPVKPCEEVGRVLVPENQDVFLQLLGDAEVSYLAQAHDAPKDVWQPFCHHGAGYALHIGEHMEFAKKHADWADHMWFYSSDPNKLTALDGESWALFYWRLRYRVVPQGASSLGVYHTAAAEERFSFNNEPKALDE